MHIDIIGFIAATLTTISFLPQIFKIIKTGNTKAISLKMYSIFTSGVFLWLSYGILTKDKPIIFANLITFSFTLYILYRKIANKD
jgi:MtN3 and saliva related transmembrane protein